MNNRKKIGEMITAYLFLSMLSETDTTYEPENF